MYLLKNDVLIQKANISLSPQMWYALGVASRIHMEVCGTNLVVTSALDGTHNTGSLHSLGRALDIRTKDITSEEREKLEKLLSDELDPLGFDIVWEGCPGATPMTTAAHLHIEFDPKVGESFEHKTT